MKYSGTLIAVSNMGRSKVFYRDVLGLEVVTDFGANVMLEGGVFLQTAETWRDFISAEYVNQSGNGYELYFEEQDIDLFFAHLKEFDINYVHEPMEHSWGQRVVRFCDPDGHIIEVAEEITQIVKRFIASGLTVAETAVRMDVSREYVLSCL